MLKLTSIKIQMIVFLSILAAYLVVAGNDVAFLLSLLTAIATASATEAAIAFAKKKKLFFPESAIVSGLIIGFVLTNEQPLYIIAAASFLAVASKHIIRINKRHIFNPAAFGIFFSMLLLGATTQWKATYYWYIFVPAGLFFAYRMRKIPLVGSYLITALGIFGIQAMAQHVSIGNIFGYLSYFFIFVMVIEPKTTPATQAGKILFGFIVALVIFVLTEAGVRFDVELCSLLAANAVVPLLNMLKQKKKEA